MSLKATLNGQQIRHFKAAVQCLGRIGAELLIEALPEKLILRSINSSRSAYASVTFYSTFFRSYDVFETAVVQAGVLVKQALVFFRTPKIADMALMLSTNETQLSCTVRADNGLEKEYQIPCMDSEILQATVDKDAFPTFAVAATSELNRLLASFQSGLEEITIIALPVDDAAPGGPGKALQLHSFLDPTKGAPWPCCFRQDFRHMLALCEGMGANCAVRFDCPGAPLVVEPSLHGTHAQDLHYTAELVLATLLESQASRLAEAKPAPATAARGGAGLSRAATPGAARSPNVPGDTPWHANGRTPAAGFTPHTSRFAPGAATEARPSRFVPAPIAPREPPSSGLARSPAPGSAAGAAPRLETGWGHDPGTARRPLPASSGLGNDAAEELGPVADSSQGPAASEPPQRSAPRAWGTRGMGDLPPAAVLPEPSYAGDGQADADEAHAAAAAVRKRYVASSGDEDEEEDGIPSTPPHE